MTPNTLRIALGLVVLGAAPLGLTAFPQQAFSEISAPQSAPTAAEMIQPSEAEATPPEAMEATEGEAMGADSEATPGEPMTIADITAGNEDFEILAAAIEAADLTEALSNEEIAVTVFAPTDEAFEALPAGALEALLLPENRDQLLQLLTYHVVDGEVYSTDLISGEVGTLAGAPVMVMVDEETVTINQANLLAADIQASNGVIHVIDSVLLPM